MKRAIFFFFLFSFVAGNTFLAKAGSLSPTALVNKVIPSVVIVIEGIPLGEAEEKSQEDTSEDDDETFGFHHKWINKKVASNADRASCYRNGLFQNPERKVVIPPPRG